MTLPLSSLLVVLLSVAVSCLAGCAHGAAERGEPGSAGLSSDDTTQPFHVVTEFVGGAPSWYEIGAAAYGDSETFVAVMVKDPPLLGERAQVEIWSFGNGEEPAVVAGFDARGIWPGRSKVRALHYDKPTRSFLTVLDHELQPALVVVSEDGEVQLARELNVPAREALITKAVPLPDGSVLLIGRADLDVLLVKVSSRGDILWQRIVDLGRADYAVDALPEPGGTFLLVMNSGDYAINGSGPSEIHIGRFNATTAEQTTAIHLAGTGGAIARTDESVVLVYALLSEGEQSGHVTLYDERLRELSSQRLFSEPMGMQAAQFAIARLRSGGFLVCGTQGDLPYMAMGDSHGRVAWRFVGDGMRRAPKYWVVMSEPTIGCVSSVYEAQGPDAVQQRMRFLRVTPRE